MMDFEIYCIIPTLNEEESLPGVLDSLAEFGIPLQHVCVADNGSSDQTQKVAITKGALLTIETEKGYGATCLKAMEMYRSILRPQDILVFLDGDGSDDLRDLELLLLPIQKGQVEFTLGSRMLGGADPDSLGTVQRFGNFLTSFLLQKIYAKHFTDLGPFRAIRWGTLLSLDMKDRNYGWTVEMQIKVAKREIPFQEIPVRYHSRKFGKSKVSGSFWGSFQAGKKILSLVFREWFYD